MLTIFPRSAGLLALIGAALPAAAQPSQEPELPVVTVTVNKQSQALERVPASVSAFGGDELEAAGIDSLEGVAQMTPGFTFQASGQSGLQPPVMRGLTANIM